MIPYCSIHTYDPRLAQGTPFARVFPGCQPHVRLIGIGPGADQLTRCVTGDRVEHFILDRRVEGLHGRRLGVVILAESKDIPHFLIERHLGRTNVADALEQLVELLLRGILHAFVVHDEAFDEILLQCCARSPTELHTAGAVHTVPDRKDCIEVIGVRAVSLPIRGRYQGFLDN